MILSFGASATQVKDVLCLPVGHAGRFELACHLNRPEHTRRADSRDEQRAGLPGLENLGGVGGAGNMRGVDTRDCTNRSAANRAEGCKFDLCEGRPSLTDGIWPYDSGRPPLRRHRLNGGRHLPLFGRFEQSQPRFAHRRDPLGRSGQAGSRVQHIDGE